MPALQHLTGGADETKVGAAFKILLSDANVKTVLFDLPAKEGPKNGIVNKALDGLKKLQPGPLASKGQVRDVVDLAYKTAREHRMDPFLLLAVVERVWPAAPRPAAVHRFGRGWRCPGRAALPGRSAAPARH